MVCHCVSYSERIPIIRRIKDLSVRKEGATVISWVERGLLVMHLEFIPIFRFTSTFFLGDVMFDT